MLLKLGKDTLYFDLLASQAGIAAQAAEGFRDLVANLPATPDRLRSLAHLEHEGDRVIHQIFAKLAGTFITPLDQEDIGRLANLLDDITDSIEAVSARVEIFQIQTSRPDLMPLVELLVQATQLTKSAVEELHFEFARSKTLPVTLEGIHDVESASDKAFRNSLATLFQEPGIDAITLIKWKEIYDRIEVAIDRCKSVANVIGGIAMKYG